MKIRDIMETNVISIPASATYEEAAKTLYEHKISGAPIVDPNGILVGAISEKDLFRVLYPFPQSFYQDPESYLNLEERENKITDIRNKSVSGFMATNPVVIAPDDAIMRAGALMLAKRIHRLFVVERGKVIGFVSRGLIYRAILKQKFGW
jgi:CBS domain-containing protein